MGVTTILIIEDNDNNRKMLKDLLTYHGYGILEAENGEEGIRMARESRPELILMDIQMPVMDGFTAIPILKNDPETRGIKIIAVTSFAMVGDRGKIMKAGADDYISKPIDTRDLPVRIRKVLGQ